MKITSPAFADKIPVPTQFTCNGPDTSPPFEFLDVPKDAKSLVLIVEDLDSDHWIHWLVYNIPATITHFDEGKTPEGAVEGVCNKGTRGYHGPCPKMFKGLHRYSFRLYALSTMLDVPSDADAKLILMQMQGFVLEEAELIGVAEGEQVSESIK